MPTASRKPASVKKGRTFEFDRERETKGAVRFKEVTEDGEDYLIGSLYMRKALDKELGNPESVKVQVTVL